MLRSFQFQGDTALAFPWKEGQLYFVLFNIPYQEVNPLSHALAHITASRDPLTLLWGQYRKRTSKIYFYDLLTKTEVRLKPRQIKGILSIETAHPEQWLKEYTRATPLDLYNFIYKESKIKLATERTIHSLLKSSIGHREICQMILKILKHPAKYLTHSDPSIRAFAQYQITVI